MLPQHLKKIELPVTFGLGSCTRREDIDIPYAYNAIFGRRFLNTFNAIPHSGFLCMKMGGHRGIIKVLEDQELA